MDGPREHLLGLTAEELTARVVALGMPRFRAGQIQEWIFKKRVADFAQMSNLSLADRQALAERFVVLTGTLVREQRSPDGTLKVLTAWPDGGTTESVLIPCDDDQCDEYGNTTVAHRRTACLSTQVGCPVGCKFCASGLDGWKENLTIGQIIEQAWRLAAGLPTEGGGSRLTNVVFMGMGEPLANYAATLGAVRTLMAPWGFHISGRKITVSTVGLPPQMKKLAGEGLPVTLAISLHAPNDAVRKQIIPWAGKIPLPQIIEAGRYYFEKTGRELTLEYLMLDGLNTLPEHARELAAVAKQMRANVNLIYYNEVPGLRFKRPSGQTMLAFENLLRAAKVNVHIRRSRGREIAAACGQLARQDRQEGGAQGGGGTELVQLGGGDLPSGEGVV